MRNYSLDHLSDAALLRELVALVARDRLTTAELLAHIAEVDARKLYVPAGYPSMHAYCVDELRLSEDAAFKRIRAARAALRFPVLFSALTEGRLHLAAICLIAGHLTTENVDELIAAATHRKKFEIEIWLARHFATPEPRSVIRPIAAEPKALAVSEIEAAFTRDGLAPESGEGQLALGPVDGAPPVAASPQPERYLVQVTISKNTHDKLRYAQELLSHVQPRGDVALVLDRALDSLIPQLEKRKFGAAKRPQSRPRSSKRARHIPAQVRRAVWERDRGQCTFVAANGRRCPARNLLEFDHVEPVALGGKATVAGMRLRCRAHNQYEAERAFGAGFMDDKRRAARVKAREREAKARVAAQERIRDVLAGLRSLGCRADEARRAAEHAETLQLDTLEERMRAALQFLNPKLRRDSGAGISSIPARSSSERSAAAPPGS
jgi:hypothetical protein